MALSAQDHEDIRQLLARYNYAIDFGDVDAWVACFTADGTFECLGLPEGSPLGGFHAGAAALRDYATVHFKINKGRARHWNWNLLVEGDADEASLRCYLNAQRAGQGGSAVLQATGLYDDALVRVDGSWRFRSRRVTIDGG
jgi:SnoaL-like domain